MITNSSNLSTIMATLRQQRRILYITGLGIFILLVWHISKPFSVNRQHDKSKYSRPLKYTETKPEPIHVRDYDYKIDLQQQSHFISNCFKDEDSDQLSIDKFPKLIKDLQDSSNYICKEFSELLSSFYAVRETVSNVVINKIFAHKVLKWFKGNIDLLDETKHQSVLFITNILTQESTVFNPLRAKRPGEGVIGPEVKKAVDELIKSSSKDCDFCNYKSMTAKDPFGSIDSKYAVTVANTFKIEKFHGLVLLKHHDPLNFTKEEILDVLDVALQWFSKAHEMDKDYEYPHVYWDALTKASASQIHPHAHLSLAAQRYYSGWAHLHQSAVAYSNSHNGANYFTHLVKIHSLLGLAVQLGEATAIAYITPIASHEVMLISKQPCKDLFRLLYYVMRAFIDDMNLYATSMGMVFPKMVTKSNSDLPTLIRYVYRGSQASARADLSSFDLFGTHNVNVDPYIAIRSIRRTMMKHGVLQ